MCCMVNNIVLLILIRFIQGIGGAGVAGVVGYAAIKDMYSGSEYSKMISKLNMVVALSPGMAPVIGSDATFLKVTMQKNSKLHKIIRDLISNTVLFGIWYFIKIVYILVIHPLCCVS
ncbi:Bicyclomycin resistance protein [Dirofilaria immitis]